MSIKTLYNPAGLPKEELIESFVVRTKNFERIFEDIKSSDMKYPEKHYLIQGQRGMGKTTLLLRLKYEVENSTELNKWLLPVFFSEESYDLTSLSRLWEKLLMFLDDELQTGGKYYQNTEEFVHYEDYEKRCFDYLIEVLCSKGKKIILFFDNFGQLFLDNLKEKEKRRLREILLQCSDLRIIGASAIVLQDLHDYSQPFYEFFQIVHLEGLSKEETFYLIERLQETCEHKIDLKKNKGKIDTLSILTGGVIRTLMMVYQVLLDDQDGSALRDLEIILDQVTPLYKHRIEDLPVQQRRIVDVIAKRWDAISAKEIAEEIREDGKKIQTKLISAQLSQLEKNNVVEKKQTNTKNHLYQLKERFFNIWYLMRNGDRRDQRKVRWLTKFLEVWYDDEEEIDLFLERHVSLLKSGKYNPKSALLVAEALFNSEKINPMKLDILFDATSGILSEEQKALLPDMGQKKFALAARSYQEGDIEKGIDILERTNGRKNSHKLLLSFFYFIDDQLEKSKHELSDIGEIELADLDLLKNLCILLQAPILFWEIINRSPHIGKATLAFEMAEVYFAISEYTLAEKYYWKAFNSGVSKSIGPLAQIHVKKGDLTKGEELFLAGLEVGSVDPKEILDFYYFEFEGDLIGRTRQILNMIPKNDAYYNYYQGVELLKSRKETEELHIEIKNFFEKAILDFDKAGVRDFKYQQAVGHTLILNLGSEPNKKVIAGLLPRLDELENLKAPLKIYKAFTLSWFGEYKKAVDILYSTDVMDEVLKNGFLVEDFNDVILLLLSKNQYHLSLDIFSKFKDLKEVLKPTYYALMTLLKDEYPNEIIKMGEELSQPVNDVLIRIEEMKLEYK